MTEMAKPSYDPKQLKRGLPFVNGLDFEIHESFVLIKVRAKSDGPTAVIRATEMPKDTTTLVHVIKCTYSGLRHSLVTAFTLSKGKETYTREGVRESGRIVDSFRNLGLMALTADARETLVADVHAAGARADDLPLAIDEKLPKVEWSSAAAQGNQLRDDVVQRAGSAFGRLKRLGAG